MPYGEGEGQMRCRRRAAITRYTGARPTTSTIAGIVIGSRQTNSSTRRRRGNLSCTSTIVGGDQEHDDGDGDHRRDQRVPHALNRSGS